MIQFRYNRAIGAIIDSVSRDSSPDKQASQETDAYRLDVASGTLWRGALPLPLRAKTLGVLRLLTSRAGQVVSSDEMRELVWNRKHGNVHGPKQCIRELRVLLKDDPATPRYIDTVGRRGYRFIGQINLDVPLNSSFDEARVADVDELPCVGRSNELDYLADGLVRARKGARVVYVVNGAAGAGKTKLVDHFISDLSQDESLWIGWAQCTPQPGSREPYGPLLQMLSQLAKSGSLSDLRPILRHVAPSWLVQLPGLFEAAEIADMQALRGAAPERMARELIEVLERLTFRRSGLLVLEDLHWADASTIAWLGAWSLRRAPSRLMIICTCRSDEVGEGDTGLSLANREWSGRSGIRRVDLSGLKLEAVEALLEARFPCHDFPASLARDLTARTAGHALFIAEVIGQWKARGCIALTDGRWRLQAEASALLDALPASVQAIVGRQMIDAFLVIASTSDLEEGPVRGQAAVLMAQLREAISAGIGPEREIVIAEQELRLAHCKAPYSLQLSFHADRGRLSCTVALREMSSKRIMKTFRLQLQAEGDETFSSAASRVSEGVVNALNQALKEAARGLGISEEEAVQERFRNACRLLSVNNPKWLEHGDRLGRTREQNPGDADTAIQWCLHLFSRLVMTEPFTGMSLEERDGIETEIESIVLECLPAIENNSLLMLAAAKLLYFINRGHLDLAEEIAERAFAPAQDFTAGLPILGQLKYARGHYDEADKLFDRGIDMATPGSPFHWHMRVLKCLALVAAGHSGASAAQATDIGNPGAGSPREINLMLIWTTTAPNMVLPPASERALLELGAAGAAKALEYQYFSSARHIISENGRANLMRNMITRVTRLYGSQVIPDFILLATGAVASS